MLNSVETTEIVKHLPHKPGVYRFYGEGDLLLYVGKAKDLKNRVSSYFQQGRPKNERLTLMISQIVRVEYTVVSTEKESLILESNLIHQLQPKYNILLKDDKSYLYVRITDQREIPGIFLTRQKYDPNSTYFGPYTKKYGISDTLWILRQIFPYCQNKFIGQKACPYVSIKQCDGICYGREKREDYLEKIAQIKNVLMGKTDPVIGYLLNQIQKAVQDRNFELAALFRDKLNLFKETVSDQKIILPQPQDLDIITLILSQKEADGVQFGSVFVQIIRDGKMINVNNFLLSGSEDSLDENADIMGKSVDEVSTNDDHESPAFVYLERFLRSFYSFRAQENPVLVQIYQDEPES